MSTRRRLIVLAGSIVLLVALVFFTRSREPRYQGHTLTYWVLACYWTAPDKPTRQQAADAIRQIGTNAVPFLLDWIHYEAPFERRDREESSTARLRWLVSKLGIEVSSGLTDTEQLRADATWFALGILGADAKSAVPELTRLLNEPRTSTAVGRAALGLGRMGEPGLPSLQAALTNGYRTVRCRAAANLGFYTGTNSRPFVVQSLMNAARDEEWTVAEAALRSLHRLNADPRQSISLATGKLGDRLPETRAGAARHLWTYGPKARTAAPALLGLLNDPDLVVRRSATNALLTIAPEVLTNAPAH